MPMPAMWCRVSPALLSAIPMTSCTLRQISVASCSTQPERGRICSRSFWPDAMAWPALAKMIARDEVVPWSMASTWSGMGSPSLAASGRGALGEVDAVELPQLGESVLQLPIPARLVPAEQRCEGVRDPFEQRVRDGSGEGEIRAALYDVRETHDVFLVDHPREFPRRQPVARERHVVLFLEHPPHVGRARAIAIHQHPGPVTGSGKVRSLPHLARSV